MTEILPQNTISVESVVEEAESPHISEENQSILSHRISRRRVLGLGGVILLAGIGIKSKVFERGSSLTETIPNVLTMESALAMCDKFTKLYDEVPENLRIGITSQQELQEWVEEIVPYFAYDQIDDPNSKPGEMGGLQYPISVTFQEFDDPSGYDQNHSLGSTNSIDHSITLNARLINPVSSWYGASVSISKLAHELVHAQGVNNFNKGNNRLDEEVSAQIISLEVMATMVETGTRMKGGNKRVVASILGELSTMSIDAAYYLALQEKRMDEYTRKRNKIFSPFIQARLDKSQRYRDQDDTQKGMKIIELYSYIPLLEIIKAFGSGDRIDGIELPVNWQADYNNAHRGEVYGGSYSRSEKAFDISLPEPTPLPTRPLIIDDLHYFFYNAENIVKDLAKVH